MESVGPMAPEPKRMTALLDVNTVFFTVLGYPMSYIEFFGTLLNLWSVYLTAKNKVLSWPVGLVAVVLFFLLFYEIRLYSDMVEQAYFFFTAFWGWWAWTHPKKAEDADEKKELKITRGTNRDNMIALCITAFGTVALGAFMARVHVFLPAVFTAPADYPYLDAFTTVMSFVATVLMVRKKIECWYLWILVDVIGIWLYFVKDVRFISLEYVIFLILATGGFFKWRRIMRAAAAPSV